MKKLLIITGLIILPLLFISCQKQAGTGTLSLSLTDSPIDSANVTGVFITINEINVNTADSGWVKVTGFSGPKSFNLLDLTRGNSDLLGNVELPGGSYTQIRFLIDAPVKGSPRPTNPGCYVEFRDGTTQQLFVPSGASSGYKAIGSFSVPVNGTVSVAADFDVRKSVHATGPAGSRLILSPVIRLVVSDQAGSISGTVSNMPSDSSIVIYAYQAGAYTPSEAADPANPDVSRFPNAVTSDKADSAGLFHLAFLAPGSYDLIVTTSKDGLFGKVRGIVLNINVTSNQNTTGNIDYNLLK